MKILILGGYGLIGSAVAARLARDGHAVTGVGRDTSDARVRLPQVHWLDFDLEQATDPRRWHALIAGFDAIVNCAGALQDEPDNSLENLQHRSITALIVACEQSGVRKLIHLSAIAADRRQVSAFSATKRKAEEALAASSLDWIVLRPGFVFGPSAFGGSALFRGLAALPVLPVPRGVAPAQCVHIDDLCETIVFFLKPDAPARLALDVAAEPAMGLGDIVSPFREWLGLKPARVFVLPGALSRLAFLLGDFVAMLGWRPPFRSNARLEMAAGAAGDPARAREITGLSYRSLRNGLRDHPAGVQEQWFARLYFLKPLAIAILSLFWISTAFLALGPGYGYGEALMREGGVYPPWDMLVIVAGGLLDLCIGAGIAYQRTTRITLWVSVLVAVLYAIIGTVLVPRLWLDPLGPMVKIWPIIVFTFVTLAVLRSR